MLPHISCPFVPVCFPPPLLVCGSSLKYGWGSRPAASHFLPGYSTISCYGFQYVAKCSQCSIYSTNNTLPCYTLVYNVLLSFSLVPIFHNITKSFHSGITMSHKGTTMSHKGTTMFHKGTTMFHKGTTMFQRVCQAVLQVGPVPKTATGVLSLSQSYIKWRAW